MLMNSVPLNCGLDELLGGGVRARTITQVYGPSGSGKTNLAMQAAVNAVRMGKKVAFIDPESGFSEKRLQQIAGKDYERVLENTFLFEPSSLKEQGDVIAGLAKHEGLGLIIVDSIVYYYRLEMDHEKPREAHQELGLQLAQLLDLARKKNLSVLVTNQVYSDVDTGNVEPVGGDILKYGSKIIMELSKEPRKARLVKHKFLKSGQEKDFEIIGKGLK
jgi:DNA repair protein RadB